MRAPRPAHAASRPLRTRRTALLALTGVCAAATATAVVLAPPASAEDVYLRPASGSWTIDGHGWGHGHGLSQYGAQGGASIGKTADQITAFYYPNTTRAVIANTAMRVLLSSDTDNTTEVYPATGLVATDLATGVKAVLPGGFTRWRAVTDGAGLHLQSTDSKTAGWTTHPMNGTTSFAGPLRFSGPTFVRLALPGGTSRDYRGALQAVRSSATALSTVDVLSMEDYLLGVVPRESLSSWQAAALQAQSIAARSYSDFKRVNVAASAQSDICDTTTCQVFSGSRFYAADGTQTELEPQTTSAAIRATAGVVRVDANRASIFAEFSASNGGWSTDGAKPYLIAQRDDWDGLVRSTVHSWSTTLPVAALESRFPAVGTLQRLRVTARDGNGDWGGRVQTVILEGRSASGAATSVTTTGTAIKQAYPWPGGSAPGLRSTWWQVRPANDSRQVSRTSDVTLVKAPGAARTTLSALVENTGTAPWPVAGLHLAVAGPSGAADPLAGGSTSPGAYLRNRTHPGAPSVLPGDQVDFTVAVDAAGVADGVRTASYRVRLGDGTTLGDVFSWGVTVRPASFAARVPAPPTLVSTTLPAGPAALSGDGRTVVVPVGGSTVVRLSASPTGNLSWPVGGTTPVRLGTTGPQDRSSSFAGVGWLSPGRAAPVAADAPVEPGATGTFDVRLNGNNAPVGVTRESFAPVWEGQSWTAGASTDLTVVRVDPALSRAATVEVAPMARVALSNAPTGTGTIVVRLRNVGGAAWTVGQESLATSSPAGLATAAWSSSTRPPALSANVSRPGQGAVRPGEVGEWRVPLSGAGKRVGTTSMVLRATGPTGGYGPSFTVSTTVFAARIAAQRVAAGPFVTVPSHGLATTWFDVRNVGNAAWPVGGMLHSLVPARGGSPSRDSSWLSSSRPASLTGNLSVPGAALVQPGQTARFALVLAGNGRSPRTVQETFGIIWDGITTIGLSAPVSYAVR